MAHIDPLAVAVGKAVKDVIKEADFTITSFRDAAGFAQRTLSTRINGHTCFDYSELMRVAEVTGVPLPEIAARAQRILDRSAA